MYMALYMRTQIVLPSLLLLNYLSCALEEEGVVLELGVGRLQGRQHSGYCHASGTLNIVYSTPATLAVPSIY